MTSTYDTSAIPAPAAPAAAAEPGVSLADLGQFATVVLELPTGTTIFRVFPVDPYSVGHDEPHAWARRQASYLLTHINPAARPLPGDEVGITVQGYPRSGYQTPEFSLKHRIPEPPTVQIEFGHGLLGLLREVDRSDQLSANRSGWSWYRNILEDTLGLARGSLAAPVPRPERLPAGTPA